jgi:hypothetical protein
MKKNNNNFTPVAVYAKADVLKFQVYLENQGKSGIYSWINLINGKQYVGSLPPPPGERGGGLSEAGCSAAAVDLRKRMISYYSLKYLASNTSMAIFRALKKYGHSNFRLEILKYCSPEKCIKWEQFYIDLLSPEYNILKIAGSSLGHSHTEESRAKISVSRRNNPSGNSQLTCQTIEVIDLETNISTKYNSICEAARALNCDHSSITSYFRRNQIKPYKRRFIFTKIDVGN